MKAKKPTEAVCKCPPNSPFRWAERYEPGCSVAAPLQRGAKRSGASAKYVDKQRAAGVDVGHIHGLTDKPKPARMMPQRFVTKGAKP